MLQDKGTHLFAGGRLLRGGGFLLERLLALVLGLFVLMSFALGLVVLERVAKLENGGLRCLVLGILLLVREESLLDIEERLFGLVELGDVQDLLETDHVSLS